MITPNGKSKRNRKLAIAGGIAAIVMALAWGGRELYRTPPRHGQASNGTGKSSVVAQVQVPTDLNMAVPIVAAPAPPDSAAPVAAVTRTAVAHRSSAAMPPDVQPSIGIPPEQAPNEQPVAAVDAVPSQAVAVAAPAPVPEVPAAAPVVVVVTARGGISINETSRLGKEFKFIGMDYILNGHPLDVPSMSPLRTHASITAPTIDGRNELQVRATATGNAKYLFKYLKDYTFTNTTSRFFDAHANDRIAIDASVYDSHNMLKQMSDRLMVTLQVVVQPAETDAVPPVPVAVK